MLGLYRASMRFTRWCLRLVTGGWSGIVGCNAATVLCLVGGPLVGSSNDVLSVPFVLAVPLWIVVSVVSYKALKRVVVL